MKKLLVLLALLLVSNNSYASITFTGQKQFTTPNNTVFTNVPQASQSFKIRIDSATNTASIPGETGFNTKSLFGYWHTLGPHSNPNYINIKFTLGGINGRAQYSAPIKIGTIYHVAMYWDGVSGNHNIWINGTKASFGTNIKGNLSTRIDPLTLGSPVNYPITFTIDDHNTWHNYLLTQADVDNLYHNGDPTQVGVTVTQRYRWTFNGTKGTNVLPSDTGLKNSLGTGPDYSTVTGTGTAVYNTSLLWTPILTIDKAYAATSGKIITMFFKGPDGTRAPPINVTNVPTLTVNGTNVGTLEKPWFTGYHPFLFYSTPENYQIRPGDIVTLDAPIAWCKASIGDAVALSNYQIDNRVGKSINDYGPRTLKLGVNNPQQPEASNLGFYHPLKNLKYKFGIPGVRGMANQNWSSMITSYHGVNNGSDNTFYPGIPGLWLIMWDSPDATTFDFISQHPEYTSIVENATLANGGTNGFGKCRVFNITSIAGATTPNLDILVRVFNTPGKPNYSNLWVVAPGDWELLGGKVYLNRTDPYALSRYYQSRLTQNVGSLRWVDSSGVGGNPTSFPYPEYLKNLSDENWGDFSAYGWHIGATSIGPVNTNGYVYSPFFKNGIYTVTLTNEITTTPLSGTKENITISGDTVLIGLELTIDDEVMRIINGNGNILTVNRGSSGTTPATHSANSTIKVSGRLPITRVLKADGSQIGATVIGVTTATAHGLTTGNQFSLVASPGIALTTNETVSFIPRQVYITGPNTLFEIYGGKGGIPNQTYTLNPATTYFDKRYSGASIPHEACAIITGKFPKANLWVNVWPDATDDLVYELAKRVKANFPAGRKVYVEYDNEVWNWAFTGFYYHTAILALANTDNPFPLIHYLKRSVEVHNIFRKIFADRAGEIVGLLNCQMGGTDANNYLTYAANNNLPIDAIAVAPYVSTEDTPLNAKVFNSYDDEQGIDMFVHDLYWNPNYPNGSMTAVKSAITKYNIATGKNCQLIGYEGGIETVPPKSSVNYINRNKNILYNPNWYYAETDFYNWVQASGFDMLQVYALSMFWQPLGWGMYHSMFQPAGYGDGSNASDGLPHLNSLYKFGVKGANTNQDLYSASTRGQAFIDFLNGGKVTYPSRN